VPSRESNRNRGSLLRLRQRRVGRIIVDGHALPRFLLLSFILPRCTNAKATQTEEAAIISIHPSNSCADGKLEVFR
jgi:hypothetical protein